MKACGWLHGVRTAESAALGDQAGLAVCCDPMKLGRSSPPPRGPIVVNPGPIHVVWLFSTRKIKTMASAQTHCIHLRKLC